MRTLLLVIIAGVIFTQLTNQQVTAEPVNWANCANCHEFEGPTLPPLSTLRPNQVFRQNIECLDCHQRNELFRVGGSWTHPVRDVGSHISCTMCHPAVAHGKRATPPLPTGDYNHEGCFACHRDIEAKFASGGGHSVIVTCRECHPPHQQMDAALPITLLPIDVVSSAAASYDWYSSNENCLFCHSPAPLMTQLSSGFATLNTENYHDIHVARGRVLCVECHDPHGSLSSSMIRSELPSGEIMLYMEAPDGGTCAVICHGVEHDNWRYINDIY